LRADLSKVASQDRRAHWPTAAALFAAHPALREMLAAHGVSEQQAQQRLDQLWELVSRE